MGALDFGDDPALQPGAHPEIDEVIPATPHPGLLGFGQPPVRSSGIPKLELKSLVF